MRMARRFYANTESYSWNLTSGSPAAQHVTHDLTPAPSKDGLNETAYRSYARFCATLRIAPLSFPEWSRIVDRTASPADVAMRDAFHGYEAGEYGDRTELSNHLTARQKGVPVVSLGDGAVQYNKIHGHS